MYELPYLIVGIILFIILIGIYVYYFVSIEMFGLCDHKMVFLRNEPLPVFSETYIFSELIPKGREFYYVRVEVCTKCTEELKIIMEKQRNV